MVQGGTVPAFFTNPGERAIVSYDFVDIASGTGHIGFNLGITYQAGAYDYILTTTTPYSDRVPYITAGDSVAAGATTTSYEFDTSTFILPQTIKGDMYLAMPWDKFVGDGSLTISGSLYIYDGTTETHLVTFSGNPVSNVAVGNWLIRAAISQTKVAVGDLIRLKLDFTASQSGGAQLTYNIGCDPANRSSGDFEFTKSTLYIPTKIDL